MPNTNFQTFHQMGNAINDVVRQATGRDNVQNIDMDFVTVAQRKRLMEEIITGNMVTFVTNIEGPLDYLIAQINPVQDLHGQESPWPAGGGKNLCYKTLNGYMSAGTNDAVFLTDANTRCLVFNCVAGQTYIASGVTFNRYFYGVYDSEPTNGARTEYYENLGSSAGAFTPQKTGVCVLYVNNSAIDTSTAQVEKGSTASTYAPYANICPISGWTGANITGTGKNLLDVSSNVEDYALNASGIPTSLNGWNYTQLIPVNANQSYTFSFVNTDSVTNTWSRRVHAYDANGNWIGQIATISATPNVNERYSLQFSITSGTKYVRVSYPALYSTGIQIESGSSVSTYEQYTGEVYPITFPSTVYGGNVKVNKDGSRKLVADMAILDLSNLSWTERWTGQSLRTMSNGADNIPYKQIQNVEMIAENYRYGGTTDNAQTALGNPDSVGTSVWLYFKSDNPARSIYCVCGLNETPSGKICYKLATPVEIDLTELEVIETLKGVNNVWADTGDVTVLYKNYEEVI